MIRNLIHLNLQYYVPSIKFLGPRALLKRNSNHHKTEPVKNTQTVTRTLTNLSHLPAMRIPSVRGASLSQWEMDTVNSGGFYDDTCKKVKSIKVGKA